MDSFRRAVNLYSRIWRKLRIETCPFVNLPEAKKGHWGEGFTATDMEKCVWLEPRLVAVIDYAEWTPANHLRHAKFVGLREDEKPARDYSGAIDLIAYRMVST